MGSKYGSTYGFYEILEMQPECKGWDGTQIALRPVVRKK
jgi:hypothetical protein